MKRIFVGAMCLLTLISLSALADDRTKRNLAEVSGAQAESAFVAAREVRVEAQMEDDLVAAGGIVSIVNTEAQDVTVAGGRISVTMSGVQDLILAGGILELSGVSGDDVFAAGGSLDFAANVRDDFVVAGGRVRTLSANRVGGIARIAGGDLGIEGKFAKDLYLAGGAARLDAEVVGNVEIWAGTIVLGPAARIGGTLRYSAKEPPQVAEGAVIAGGIERLPRVGRGLDLDADRIVGGIVFVLFAGFVGICLVVVVLQAVMPGLVSDAAGRLAERPWESLGIGVAVALLTPPVVVLLAVTVVGIPLAILAALAYLAIGFLALAVLAYRIALWGSARVTGALSEPGTWPRRALWTLTGMLILAVLLTIPFVGWAIVILALAAAYGALVVQSRSTLG